MNSALKSRLPARRKAFFCLLMAASVALFWPSLRALFSLVWQNDEYTHILLVVPLSATLIFLEAGRLELRCAYSFGWGAALLLLSAAVMGACNMYAPALPADGYLAVSILALVVSWIACVVLLYGIEVSRFLLFPLLFLFLMVPVPGFLLEKAVFTLQAASAQAASLLFRMSGMPVLKHGFVLSLPSLQIEIAQECSGIRSSEMLLLTSLVLGHLFLRSFWSKAVFILFVVPVAVAKNAIRIFTLSMLGLHVNPGFLSGRLHREGGVVFFVFSLGILWELLHLLQWAETRSPQDDLPLTLKHVPASRH